MFCGKKMFIFIVLSLFLQMTVGEKYAFCAVEKTDNHTGFDDWRDSFVEKASQIGVEKGVLDQVFPHLRLLPNVLRSDSQQNEFILTFCDYYHKTISSDRIKKGRLYRKKYAPLLQKVYNEYGVLPEYIIAFWGLETSYGTYKGRISILSALASLAYDQRRRTFFTHELITLLNTVPVDNLIELKGSWAGAFGHFQFMPTTFEAYQVDGNGDGVIDIVNSVEDAFFSAGNFLSSMGWNKDQRWGRQVRLSADFNFDYVDKKLPIKKWRKLGVMPLNKKDWIGADLNVEANLLMPMGINGPVFLAYDNFYIIKRWNNSVLYALSVGVLSDYIKDENFKLYHSEFNEKLSHQDIKLIQKMLNIESIDGKMGKNTKNAIKNYQQQHGIKPDGYPTKKLIQQMKGEK